MANSYMPLTDFSQVNVYVAAPYISDLNGEEQGLLNDCFRVWNAKRARNMLRNAYADGKHRLDYMGFSIPPAMKNLNMVVGWPAKAVNAHAERCIFDGFTTANQSTDPYEIGSLLEENNFVNELQSLITSSMTESCGFIATTRGDTAVGEPAVLIKPASAQWSTGIWDFRRRQLKAGLTINGLTDYGEVNRFTFFLPGITKSYELDSHTGDWYKVAEEHLPFQHRCALEPFAFRPSLDRPFGRSIINRAVMSITDDAVRTAARMEATAEFYSVPYLVLLGASRDAFLDDNGNPIPAWDFVMGHINAISKDEDGDVPTLQQLTQGSVQPHIEQMRQLACRFAGETNVPVSSLGVVTDNPQSAEAMHQAERELIIDCAAANRVYGRVLARVARNAIMLRDNLSSEDDELLTMNTKWRNPALPSVLDSGDAMCKIISSIPWIAQSTVALEEMGFTDEQITRLLNDKRKAEADSLLDKLVGASSNNTDDGAERNAEDDESNADQSARDGGDNAGNGSEDGDSESVEDDRAATV